MKTCSLLGNSPNYGCDTTADHLDYGARYRHQNSRVLSASKATHLSCVHLVHHASARR